MPQNRRMIKMTTKVVTAGVILVMAIVFGFIFWNQFTTNQADLAKGPATTTTNTAPKQDTVKAIGTDLSGVDIESIDSDSAQFDTQLSGF